MNEPPWTTIGALQEQVRELRSQVSGKADRSDLYGIKSCLGQLEHEIKSRLDQLEQRLRDLDSMMNQLLQGKQPLM